MSLTTLPEDTGQQVTASRGLPNMHCLNENVA